MSKSKKLSKKMLQVKDAVSHLYAAYDLLEGQYSNIPECCIEGYLGGRTYMNVMNSLSEKNQKKLEKWNYVPCEKCFKTGKINKLKAGTSVRGEVIFALIKSLLPDEYGREVD